MPERLHGWGEIANHIGRSVRTAQRWNARLEMPVHRVKGAKGIIVYADPSEIDEWLRAHEVEPEPVIESVPVGLSRSKKVLAAATVAVAAILLIWVLSSATDAPHLVQPGVGKVAFSRSVDGAAADIYIVNDDGTDERRLTSHPAVDEYPSISPDGLKIGFSSDRAGSGAQLFIMNIDGSGTRQVTDLEHTGASYFEGLDWHPDGTKLVFSAPPPEANGWRHLYEVNADGSGLTRLTKVLDGTEPSWLLWPKYSYDGAVIYVSVYPAYRGQFSEIAAFSRTLGLVTLTETRDNRTASELNTGSQVVPVYSKLIDRETTRGSLYKRLPDGSEVPLLLGPEPEYYDSSPTSPRGPGAMLRLNEVIFRSNRDGRANLWRANFETGELRQITFGGGTAPCWWVPANHPR